MEKKNNILRNLVVWILVIFLILAFWSLVQESGNKKKEINFSEFLDSVVLGNVDKVIIAGNKIEGTFKDESLFKTVAPPQYSDLIKILREKNVSIIVKDTAPSPFLSLLGSIAPFVLFFLLWLMFLKQLQVGGNKAFTFGKSRAKLVTDSSKKVTFEDVAGVDEAKEELKEIIEFLKDPQKFQRLGGRIPKGVILIGPPGTGKTLLAKAVAGEANVPFFSISGSDFVELFVGVGASRVRDLFEQAKKHAPCLVFIDELDAVGRERGAGLGGGHDEREQTLNQLLVEMDGFDPNDGIIVIAATNRPDILDSALLRPGRFDRRIVINKPDVKGREEILKVHTRKVPLTPDVDLKLLAKTTPGFSGADLANMVNEAALNAARNNQKLVSMKDLEYAKDKVLMGAERRSLIISEEEKRMVAFHEAGHVIVANSIPEADPIHKVSIIPRGLALGVTQQLPLDDRYNYTKSYLEAQISVLLAGRIAEEIALGKVTTGAGNDFEQATEIARKMVCKWGMSDLGPLTFADKDDLVFLGRDLALRKDFSDETAKKIDEEIKKIIMGCYNRAKEILEGKKDVLFNLAELLLEKESLTGDEIKEIIDKEVSQAFIQ
ncbi:MAG: ATP-dependent zinc metalloprotease FtsH [Candidatus Aminicenantia bacterium]